MSMPSSSSGSSYGGSGPSSSGTRQSAGGASGPVSGAVSEAVSGAVSRAGGDACPGALRLHRADDGALARVRLPGGVLAVAQADALARAARRLGDGVLHLTSRGNVQLRGLGDGCGAELADLLTGAGLLPSARRERIRNVVASPLSGLDEPGNGNGNGNADVGPWLRELDALLVGGAPGLEALSGRFLFALDDGRGDVGALGADVTLTAAADGGALLRLAGCGHTALRVPGGLAARAAAVAAAVFLDAADAVAGVAGGGGGGGSSGTDAVRGGPPRGIWRIGELPDAVRGNLLREVAHRLTRGTGTDIHATADRISADRASAATGAPGVAEVSGAVGGPSPGAVPGPDSGRVALCVGIPFGRISGDQWRLLTDCARDDGRGELRLTPWRGVVVPAVAAARADAWLARFAAAGLVTAPGSPWRGVGACVGHPGCAKSLADVRADAADVVRAGAYRPSAAGPAVVELPVYWSGCERRCGRPPGDRVDVVAVPEGYRISVVGADRPSAASVRVACGPDLTAAVAGARRVP